MQWLKNLPDWLKQNQQAELHTFEPGTVKNLPQILHENFWVSPKDTKARPTGLISKDTKYPANTGVLTVISRDEIDGFGASNIVVYPVKDSYSTFFSKGYLNPSFICLRMFFKSCNAE